MKTAWTRRAARFGLLAAGCLISGTGCEGSFSIEFGLLGGEAAEERTVAAPVDGLDTVRVTTTVGPVTVNLDETLSEARIVATLEVRAARDEIAEELLDEIEIRVEPAAREPGVLEIDIQVPSEGIITVDLVVTLPAGRNLELTARAGRITVAGNDGNVIAETDAGRVQIEDNVGDVSVETRSGRVVLLNVAGNVEAKTDFGTVTVRADLPEEGIIDVETDTGSIDIEVPGTTAAELDLRTDLGVVDAQLRLFVVTELVTRINSVTAVLNGGGGLIRARADLGSIDFAGY